MSSVAADVQPLLHAMGEPTRFRIVELLATRPHTVGEIVSALRILQPQTTKHLQALEAAGVIRVHSLGRRRVARLDREALAVLSTWFGALAQAVPDDAVLQDYQAAVDREQSRSLQEGASRTLHFERSLRAGAPAVWAAWTTPALAARWWAPRHFRVASFELEPRPGAPIRVLLREGDGTEYESRGTVEVVRGKRLAFTLAPVDRDGEPMFHARHEVTLTATQPTRLTLDIVVSHVHPDAAAAVAGLEPGWNQLLDALEEMLHDGVPAVTG